MLKCEPAEMAFAGGALWVTCSSSPLVKIDPTTGRIIKRIDLGWADGRIPGGGQGITFGRGRLWIANPVGTDGPFGSSTGGVAVIDPKTNRIPRTRVFDDRWPTDVAVGASLWVATGRSITRMGRSSLRITATVRVDGWSGDLSLGSGAIWTVGRRTARGQTFIVRVDERTARVTDRFLAERNPTHVIAGGGAVWALVDNGWTLVRIDPSTRSVVASLELPTQGWGVSLGGGSILVADFHGGLLHRVDAKSLALLASLEVGPHPSHVVVSDGVLWVTNYSTLSLRRIEL